MKMKAQRGSERPTHAQGREGSIDKRRYTLMLLYDGKAVPDYFR